MSKKLTAKDLLEEVQSIKKQASSGLNKPYPIEYEDEAELNAGIESALLDIVDGFGYLGATNVVVKGNTAYVKVEGEVELDVKKITPWWNLTETNWDKVTKDVVKLLGGNWVGEYFEYAYRLWDEDSLSEEDPFQVSLNDNPNRDWMVYNDGPMGGEIVTKSELSGDYRKDIKYIANAIKKYYN